MQPAQARYTNTRKKCENAIKEHRKEKNLALDARETDPGESVTSTVTPLSTANLLIAAGTSPTQKRTRGRAHTTQHFAAWSPGKPNTTFFSSLLVSLSSLPPIRSLAAPGNKTT